MEYQIPYNNNQEHIYWSFCNTKLGNRNIYIGLQHQQPMMIRNTVFRHNNFCSIWNVKPVTLNESLSNSNANATINSNVGTDIQHMINNINDELSIRYCLPDTHYEFFHENPTNETNNVGLHISHPMPWLFDTWYAILLRRWYILGENCTCFGLFIYSYKTERWTHYVTISASGIDTPFCGNTINGYTQCSQGNVTTGYQAFQRNHFRMNRNKSWEKSYMHHVYSSGDSKYWDADVKDDTIRIRVNGECDNIASYIKLVSNQREDRPHLSTLTIEATRLEFTYHKGQLFVNWDINETRAPQLRYHVRFVYTLNNTTVFEQEAVCPEQRQVTYYINNLKNGIYHVTLDLTDIFDGRRVFRSYCNELVSYDDDHHDHQHHHHHHHHHHHPPHNHHQQQQHQTTSEMETLPLSSSSSNVRSVPTITKTTSM